MFFVETACIIVKNEEETLGRLLDSVIAFADEIVVVDTGSTDKTKEIALNYTQKVYEKGAYIFTEIKNVHL